MSLENRHVVSGGGGRSLGVSGRHVLEFFLVGRRGLSVSGVQYRNIWHLSRWGRTNLLGLVRVGKSG